MLYTLQVGQKTTPTETYVFGTRLLLTMGVEILGKSLDPKIFTPFSNVNELIKSKAKMRLPNKTNVPILIGYVGKGAIYVTGRLAKSGSLSHDPNIGALSIICACLRRLNWHGKIIVSRHGLSQSQVKKSNKFVRIANKLDLQIEGLMLPKSDMAFDYWHYEKAGEKLGTIFLHIAVENFTHGFSIFENHAGSEKGYFLGSDGRPYSLEKYLDREDYKAGNKNQIIHIPDLVLLDNIEIEIINIEGKKHEFRANGIREINNFDGFEKHYIKKHYAKHKIIRSVVLYGSVENKVLEIEVGFLLNNNGELVLGLKPPKLFRLAIKNLVEFWR